MEETGMEDVVVIGAGLSGLTAARQLQQVGHQVIVIDKSRGLGGRLATRRRGFTAIDHGCRYLQPFSDSTLSFVPALLEAGVLQTWEPEAFTLEADGSLTAGLPGTLYTAPQGMSAVAKALASSLTIHHHWRATALTPLPEGWRIEGETLSSDRQEQPSSIEAKAVVVAIPAPQAAALIDRAAPQNEGLSKLMHQLQNVEFDAVITAMAGYSSDESASLPSQTSRGGWMVGGNSHPILRWAALDSSKRTDSQEPVAVVHSSTVFAANNIDRSDLEAVGQELLAAAAGSLASWLGSPTWMQVHRWRYGFVRQPLGSPVLHSPAVPTLVGCGDWCSGGNVEGAIASGYRAAELIATTLK
ncbi:FAD-dependent oxidoreductase [Nodosilinea sp. FACHB-13]|uniref:NAD(P)/FAD-dependent oxidoreductase n=1 Tax=Cyanophyceae TaxID=3028117 RepID=UPI0021079117|nr:FAD-dependent oxidoreductase [Nodosilinea sp. FACHB-13]